MPKQSTVHWQEREHEELDVLVEDGPWAIAMLKPCGMWKVFLVSIHEVKTQIVEPLDRVLAYKCRGFHARVTITDSNDIRHLLFDRPLQEGGISQLEYLSSRAIQHR
jgi:hypothetical protein